MARGSEAKSARKQARKEARAKEAERILNGEDAVNDFSNPPDLDMGDPAETNDSGDSEEEEATPEKTPEKTKKSKSNRAKKAAMERSVAKQRDPNARPADSGGIKTLPLVFLIMLTGTTVLPALLYMGDYLSAFAQKNHLLGNLGHRLGIGPNPKKRVISFYEKHDPEKISEVPAILAKYYGDYPKLVKRLERKYGDYGYFINWEQDEAPMHLAIDKLYETRDMLRQQFDRHAPAVVKTGVRNMQHNLGTVYKKGHRAWKKQVWPILQPYLGVPDEKAARKQKLKDKKEADKMKKARAGGGRRKSADFRDEDEDGKDEM